MSMFGNGKGEGTSMRRVLEIVAAALLMAVIAGVFTIRDKVTQAESDIGVVTRSIRVIGDSVQEHKSDENGHTGVRLLARDMGSLVRGLETTNESLKDTQGDLQDVVNALNKLRIQLAGERRMPFGEDREPF